MATKEITALVQEAGAAGDSSIGLSSSGGLVRRDTAPYDKDAAAVDSSGADLFIGVSVSGAARTFNAIPYIKGDTAATPAVDDLIIGVSASGDAKQFTVASLATTVEGASFGTGAFANLATQTDFDNGVSGTIPDSAIVKAALATPTYTEMASNDVSSDGYGLYAVRFPGGTTAILRVYYESPTGHFDSVKRCGGDTYIYDITGPSVDTTRHVSAVCNSGVLTVRVTDFDNLSGTISHSETTPDKVWKIG